MPTSEPEECFVYIQLPASMDVVTCGRLVHQRGVGRFVYRRRYLDDARAVELDKFELPLQGTTFETARLGGVFGAIRDAGPDSWGRRIIDRQLARTDLSEVEYLLNSPEDRAGALSFGRNQEPPPPVRDFNKVIQLERLLEEADRIQEGRPPSPQVGSLLNPGTSMGGARPKNVVEDGDGLWLAKFPAQGDRWDVAIVEAAMLDLARQCHLQAPTLKLQRVGGRNVLLVKRFDRDHTPDGYFRHRMVSALTVLRSDENAEERARWSYVLLADEVRRWVEDPDSDLRELFQRMVFNALISNTDDHPRNHALVARARGWCLAPVYDLNPTPSASAERDLALVLGEHGRRANRVNLLSRCERFRLGRDEANALIDEVKSTVVTQWEPSVRRLGGTGADCDAVRTAFGCEGFEFGRIGP
jgi:serine/threonine-protein kinase HipA